MYSIPYIIFYLILLFLFLNEKQRLRIINPLVSVKIADMLMILFIGLRGFVMTDFINYYSYFEDLQHITELNLFDFIQYEPGFVVYSSAIKTLFPNYHFWVFVNTLIDLALFRGAIKEGSTSRVFPYMVFLGISGLTIEFNLYRNAKAIFLFLYSLKFIWRKEPFKYFAVIFLACTFHYSAFLFFPLYFILCKRTTKIFRWGVFVLVTLLPVVGLDFIGVIVRFLPLLDGLQSVNKLADYISSDVAYGFSFGSIERILSFIIITLFYDKLVENDEKNILFYNCYLLYYVTFQLFVSNVVLVNRFPILFVSAAYILISNLVCLPTERSVWRNYFIIILLLKTVISTTGVTMQYDNVLFGIKSYNERVSTVYNASDWY